jgi:peroxiredoxin Q/BCP
MLNVGDRAPDFSVPSDSGRKVTLQDFKGHRLVLYFFPKADMPG